ncbi:MAG: glycosyltransferase family 2 protein [Methylococcaceae bacterium]|nr:glycosyltransferase family 2 protein [Methylococcaceae bacterium]
MSTPRAKILIIIVTWNKKDYVIDLLNSLSGIMYPAELLDILVVDNASDDGTVAALEKLFPAITLIRNTENLGGTGGFNTGLAWAFAQPDGQYEYLWLLDNDVVVHKHALSELVKALEHNPDAAVAGSTMLQLDYPWQINEMGAFVDRSRGTLVLNRHFEQVPGWRAQPLRDLLSQEVDLTQILTHCQATMDVDYVAAASLLIRAPIAKQSGLWLDFFIHFDDVEWCLRIANMGKRILVSANSLIWHLSAAAKVPSWILYYDNRNVLYLLEKHSDSHAVNNTVKWIAKKALYYALLGKLDLAQLHLDSIEDYKKRITGKKAITLTGITKPVDALEPVFFEPRIKRILVSCNIHTQATQMQSQLVKAMKQRPDLTVCYLSVPHNHLPMQIPGAITIAVSKNIIKRYWQYFKLRNQFDLVLQSDYKAILPLSWLGREIIFINDETYCRRPKPSYQVIKAILPKIWRYLFNY